LESKVDPTDDGGILKISIDDLIKANLIQKAIAEATLEVLRQAKSDQEELQMYREREIRRMEKLYD
jgi:hypothetical protein